MSHKLRPLLGDVQDVVRRKQLAAVASRKLRSLWVRHHRVSQDLRLRLYNACIVHMFTYNIGTWGITPTEWVRFIVSWDRSWHQIPLSNLELRPRSKMCVQSTELIIHQTSMEFVCTCVSNATLSPCTIGNRQLFHTHWRCWLARATTNTTPNCPRQRSADRNQRDLIWLWSHDRSQWKNISQNILKEAQMKLSPLFQWVSDAKVRGRAHANNVAHVPAVDWLLQQWEIARFS